ncbi:hypothetical protein N6B72_04635 [Chryseobacterium soli]|uniref:hypothetical protein n=1 Tax=Chryseobacterium soli TaxID=445961 RepID=UPI002953E573|nr:hypothetical protein [Chryseobacterium soli]MDV7696204.1 hypothetical protein [Chryseobacterium soli]
METFFLKPFIKDHYLDQDLTNFKDGSWKYLIAITVLLTIVLTICLKVKTISHFITTCIFSTVFIFFVLRTVLISIMLYINTQTEKSQITNTYKVIRYKEMKIFWLNSDKKNSINDNDKIKLIDKRRKEKGQKSLFEYKMNDTIQVKLKKGVFNVNYIE